MSNIFVGATSAFTSPEENLRSFLRTFDSELETFNSFTSLRQQFAVSRQRERASKRASISNAELSNRAVEDFCKINSLVAQSISLPADVLSDCRDFIRHSLEQFTASNTGSIQQVLDVDLLVDLWRFGPGASHDVKGTHFCEKIVCDKPTVTSDVIPLATLIRQRTPNLKSYDTLHGGPHWQIAEGSSLSTVPKNETTHRTIAIEPLYNMALQLAAGAYVQGALRCVGLDITTQEENNKLLAGIGSTFDNLATIDLKSASDLISPILIKALWPPQWYDLLMNIRSKRIRLPSGEWLDLNMMSTMGNGFTFPVMTLTLLSLIYATCPVLNRRGYPIRLAWDKTCCGVYGDDIIVKKEFYNDMLMRLRECGLLVNTDKSYYKGPFRESCGGDYYRGELVTPFYIRSLSSEPEVYIAVNGLLRWSFSQRVPVHKTYKFLLSLIDKNPCFVPWWSPEYSGVRTSMVDRRYKAFQLNTKYSEKVISLTKIPSNLALLMVLGGYVTGRSGDKVSYMRRRESTLYNLVDSRLPKGRLDGHCLLLASRENDMWVNFHTER